ncbi:uncharacterized protein LOC121887046 [Xyrichtys novacula]|uniref:Uncharacterized protein LOC121887046 n=1 Tax=Xyrichtys novacula TaxID=13765 RepID=A0AAV1EXE3_XYRNO|nr:uncharacterized protein LOC121887046 [Xyrichtys novacula]
MASQPANWLARPDEDTERLIRWRGRNKALFMGRRNAALKGFQAFIKEHGLEGQVDPSFPHQKKGKPEAEIQGSQGTTNRVSTEGGEATAANWKWFNIMDELTSSEWLKKFEEREDERLQQAEERERRAEERERQEKREMEERWVRREQEWREEERRNTDRREWEWREWMDRRAVEERRERE